MILDLGGVLIDVDYGASARAFLDLGVPDLEGFYTKARQTDLFDRFETGDLDPDGFRNAMRDLLNTDLEDARIDVCWNSMLGSIPQERLDLVALLRKKLPILLLSNTNAIHVPAFEAIVRKENGVSHFRSLFDGAYFSCELGMRKPHAEIFHLVLGEHDADPLRTLFIDDSPQHVEGARRAGLLAEHLDLEKEDVLGLVQRLGLIP